MSRPTRAWIVGLLAGVGFVSGCASSARTLVGPTTSDRFFVSGYHAYWTEDAWRDYPLDVLDQLFFFELEVTSSGGFSEAHGWPDAWRPMLMEATRSGVAVVATVSSHDVATFEELFRSSANVDRLIDSLMGLLQATPELAGLHLDFEVFESVVPGARDGFTAFVAELRGRMRQFDAGLSLSVFALAFDDDDVYNERALAELSDYLVVQGYDFHHPTDAETGPVAALEGWGRLNWGAVVDRFREFGVPPRKILMAVPLYGYEWPSETDQPGAATRGEAVTVPIAPSSDVVPELRRARAQAALHGTRRDATSGSPYYTFEDDSGWRQGWFEDAASLRAKYAFVRERGLGGIALFPLGYGDAEIWEDLRAAFGAPPR